jgi:hypothetical protein
LIKSVLQLWRFCLARRGGREASSSIIRRSPARHRTENTRLKNSGLLIMNTANDTLNRLRKEEERSGSLVCWGRTLEGLQRFHLKSCQRKCEHSDPDECSCLYSGFDPERILIHSTAKTILILTFPMWIRINGSS